MSADFAFSPKLRPSDIPDPIAIIFLIAPANDVPTTSVDGYNLKHVFWNIFDIYLLNSRFSLAITPAAGSWLTISLAKVGPDNIANTIFGYSFFRISGKVFPFSFRNPLDVRIIFTFGLK